MKKSLLFSAVLAGLMLGSCSSSDDLAGGNTPASQDGNGYVAFTINLPSQSGSSSRSSSLNDQFEDGTPNEYAVNDATLLIFEGTSESSATFKSAYKLNTAPWKDNNANENVTTTSATVVKQIEAPASAGNCFALVILNKNDVFTVDEANHTLSLGGTNFTGTYKEFAEKLSDKDLTKNGFYMANAPLASKAGGATAPTGAEINTLANLDDKIKKTESEAKSAPAEIYVERGVAKVTMQNTSSVTSVDGSKNSDGETVGFTLSSWALDNTNKKTYLVRSTEGSDKWLELATNKAGVSDKYRFVGSKPVATGLYRTYFAKDANFNASENSTALSDGSFNSISASDISKGFGTDKPQYCFENTFNVESQLDQYTTRVLIKAALNSNKTFYVINGDENTIYNLDEVKKQIKKYFLTEYKTWIKTNVTSTSGSVGENELNVNISDNAGDVTITSISFTNGATTTAELPTDYQTTVMNRIGTIQEYKDGVSYYFIRIKHFGDDLTPWNDGETPLPGSTSGVYPAGTDQNNNYLGRYGVLRNNWYNIEVLGVKGLGFAEVPKVTTDTDDELKSYIAVKINVLSWAKRTQGAILH